MSERRRAKQDRKIRKDKLSEEYESGEGGGGGVDIIRPENVRGERI